MGYQEFTRFKSQSGEGRPSSSTDDTHVQKIENFRRANRCLTVKQFAEEVLTEKLNMYRVAAQLVPCRWLPTMTKPSCIVLEMFGSFNDEDIWYQRICCTVLSYIGIEKALVVIYITLMFSDWYSDGTSMIEWPCYFSNKIL